MQRLHLEFLKRIKLFSSFLILENLIKELKGIHYLFITIHDLISELEGFKYASSLDLNIEYYYIILWPLSWKLCTIVLSWGKYEYQNFPMGLCNSPDIFQEKMNKLFDGLEYVRTYIDDLLIISNKSLEDCIENK